MARLIDMVTDSKPNFLIGQIADDLVVLTIEMCGKDVSAKRLRQVNPSHKTENPRFPFYLRDNYVQRILNTALDVQEYIYEANGSRNNANRKSFQERASSKCEYLLHLERIAYDKGWISEKQYARWSKLTAKLKWKIVDWWKSTKT